MQKWNCDFTNFLATLCQATVGHHQWKKGPKEYRHRLFLFLFVPNHLLGIKNVGSTVQPIFQVFASNHWGRILFGLGTQFYIPSDIKTQMNSVPFCFRADWVIWAVLKILQFCYSTLLLRLVFSCFHGQNNEKFWISINHNCKFLH